MGENLMEFSMVDENEIPGDEDEENYQPPTIIHSPVVVHSILKPSNKDNLIQLYTPKPTHKHLKVKFQTPQPKNVTPTRYEEIRSLDEEENWVERTAVVTKQQHTEYLEYGRDILNELIANIPISMLSARNSTNTDGTNENKIQQDNMNITNQDADVTVDSNESVFEQTLENDTVIEVPSSNSGSQNCDPPTQIDITTLVNEVPTSDNKGKNFGPSTQLKIATSVNESSKNEQEPQKESISENKVEKSQGEIKTSPLLPTRGSYNIDLDNLDSVNPFAAKSAVANSPVLSSNNYTSEKLSSSVHEEDLDVTLVEKIQVVDSQEQDERDPFKPKSQICNSPIKQAMEDSDSETEFQDALSEVESDKEINKNKVMETPDSIIVPESTLELPENKISGTSPRLFDLHTNENEDLLSEITTSQTEDIFSQSFDDIDPFKPATQIPNSPPSMELDLYIDNNTESNSDEQILNSAEMTDSDTGSVQKIITDIDSLTNLIPDKIENFIENKKDILEENDPFKPSKQIMNFPDKSDVDPFEPAKQIINSPDKWQDVDPFKPAKQIMNSPDKSDVDPFKPAKQIINSPDKSDVDPFKPSNQIKNSPDKSEDVDPFKPANQIMNSPNKSDVDPFKPSNQIKNSPDKSEDVDPFKPANQIMNSPDKSDVDPFKPAKQIMNSPDKSDVDPFKPAKQIMNSPDKSDVDPFKPSKQIMNSPDKVEMDPFKPSQQTMNSPGKSVKVDTSELTKQSVNSHVVKSEDNLEIDPFKPGKQIVNSPNISVGVDPFKASKQIMNSPVQSEGVDPFKTSKQIMNSPVQSEKVDPFKVSNQIMNSPDVKSEEKLDVDPFKPATQIMNSPVKSEVLDPFKVSKQIVNSPDNKVDINFDIDPFKSTKQLMNSPIVNSADNLNIDPFEPMKQTVNSEQESNQRSVEEPKVGNNLIIDPINSVDPTLAVDKQIISDQDSNLLITSKQPSESSTSEENEHLNIDPFKCNKQLAVSPNPGSIDQVLVEENTVDPFKPKTQIMNSPTVNAVSNEESPFMTQSKIANSPQLKTEKKADIPVTMSSDSKDSEQKEKTDGVNSEISEDKKSEQTTNVDVNFNNSSRTSAAPRAVVNQGFEIEDDQFKPASEIFNSPSAWEMLEQFGSSSNVDTDLTRQSLYVKFDPLVNLPLNDPRRASIGLRRSSIGIRSCLKTKQLRDLNPEESFLLLGTPPKQRSRRITNLGTKSSSISIPEEGTPKSCKAPVDLLFSSPSVGQHKVVQEDGRLETVKDVLNVVGEQPDTDIVQVLQYTDADIQQLRQVMSLEFQGILMSKEKEWSKLVNDQEKEKQSETKKLKAKQEEVDKTTKDLENMMLVVGEYEKIINQLIGEKEKNTGQFKESSSELKKERDQALEDVQSLENSFADLHKRYEKLRAALEGSKKNEDILKKCAEDYRIKLKKAEEKLTTLKKDAEEKLTKANQEIEKLKSEKESDIAKLEAALKRKEMQVDSLQKSYDQKVKENQELTDLCDQLIGKVGK